MKKLGFAIVGAGALALAACGGRDDTLEENLDQNADIQANALNTLADNAAAEAELEALGNQQQQLEDAPAANETENEADDVTTEPSQVEDDVQGM